MMNMVITNQQEAENFVLSYLETHQEFLKLVFQKFTPSKKVGRKRNIKRVRLTQEEEESLKTSLNDVQYGNLTRIDDTKIWLNQLVKENV
jgi:hypothetical protein